MSMKLIIAAVFVAILVIVIKKLKERKRQTECDELRNTIRNSGIIKELTDCLQDYIAHHKMDWSYKQIDYYDDCDRLIRVYNSGIIFFKRKNDDWLPLFDVDFVENLGYKPLLDNGLRDGKKYITDEDIYVEFTDAVRIVIKNLFDDDRIEYGWAKYSNGFQNQKQADGSYKSVRVGEENAYLTYKVPKSIDAKQI